MARRSLALLSYEFLFDPSNTWSSISQFEQSFNKYLQSLGLEAEFIKSIGSDNKQILYICPMDKIDQSHVQGNSKPTAPQDVIKKYIDPKTYQGRK